MKIFEIAAIMNVWLSLPRSLMKVHYPKLYNMAHLSLNVFTASKGSNNYILFSITAAGVVPCGGPKNSHRTSSIVQIIFFF